MSIKQETQETQANAPGWIIIDSVGIPTYKMSINGGFRIGADCRLMEKKRFSRHMLSLYPEATAYNLHTGIEFERLIHRACDNLFNNPDPVEDLALWSNETKKFEENQLQISFKQEFQGQAAEGFELVLADREENDTFELFDRYKVAMTLFTVCVKKLSRSTIQEHYRTSEILPPKAASLARLKMYRVQQYFKMEAHVGVEAFFRLEDAVEHAKQYMPGDLHFEIDPEEIDRAESVTHGQLEHRTICEVATEDENYPYHVVMLNHALVYTVRRLRDC
jgi:hypothetical protein